MIQTPILLRSSTRPTTGCGFIHTDGRPLPKQGRSDAVVVWIYRSDVGKGDTLVTETNNLRDDGWLDVRGSPLTDQATIRERYRRPSFGRLEIDITIDDPKAYTKPFTVRVNQQIQVDTEMIEFICNENQQFRRRVKID
jgi:hypothetical protein